MIKAEELRKIAKGTPLIQKIENLAKHRGEQGSYTLTVHEKEICGVTDGCIRTQLINAGYKVGMVQHMTFGRFYSKGFTISW